MSHRVYRVAASRRALLDRALSDDVLSRQSINVREARHFGEPGEHLYVIVEGTETGLFRADALLLDVGERAPEAEAIYEKYRAEEDEAASSLGAVFPD